MQEKGHKKAILRRKPLAKKKRRGPGPVIAVVLAGMISCWMGLVKVDRQIRSVTINQSPPLWESREEGDVLRVILLGRKMSVDLSPVKRAGETVGELLRTPPAPARLARGVWEALERELKPKPRHSWKKGFL